MPRLILKCPYLKGSRGAARRGNYLRYIATRKGVELTQGEESLPGREGYLQYIAQRPHVQRVGRHGLFSASDKPISLSNAAEELSQHSGNVWTPILSLRREDAARLGYDHWEQWQALLRAHAPEVAEAMKIPFSDFRWYAAFHNEGHHPHVHMVCYSADPSKGYLTKEGLAQMRSVLARDIFRQDLTEIYKRQTQSREDLVRESQTALRDAIRKIREGPSKSSDLEPLLLQLAEKLSATGGKKQYGYLKAPVKKLVDEIVEELAKDPAVSEAYRHWYDLREEVLRTYRDDLPERIPLSGQKEFRQIKKPGDPGGSESGRSPAGLRPPGAAVGRTGGIPPAESRTRRCQGTVSVGQAAAHQRQEPGSDHRGGPVSHRLSVPGESVCPVRSGQTVPVREAGSQRPGGRHPLAHPGGGTGQRVCPVPH